MRRAPRAAAPATQNVSCTRNADRFSFASLPERYTGWQYVHVGRGNGRQPSRAFGFDVDQRVRVHLAVQNRGEVSMPPGWQKTEQQLSWEGSFTDTVYTRVFGPGRVEVPSHTGRDPSGYYGVPHMAFIEDLGAGATAVHVNGLTGGVGAKHGFVQTSEEENPAADLEPGHWTWNPHNWHACAGFLKHMPWDSVVVKLEEDTYDDDMRIMSFKRPDGRLVLVLSNRCFAEYTFNIDTGLSPMGAGMERDPVFKGYRYTPDNAGEDFRGVPLGALSGRTISPAVPDMAWEFWVQQ